MQLHGNNLLNFVFPETLKRQKGCNKTVHRKGFMMTNTSGGASRASRLFSPALALVIAPLAALASWIVYSRFAIDHSRHLPAALPGERFELDTPAGRISAYGEAAVHGRPLLLVHSINAAASSYEVRPLYLHYRLTRPVYAIDLPGFGFSERSRRIYTPRIMVDALHAIAAEIRRRHGGLEIDILALSLSSEYAARAALERPVTINTLGLISPTGFDHKLSGWGPAQSTQGSIIKLAAVSVPLWSQALFDLFVTRASMRLFLEKTWGSKCIDKDLFEYDQATAHRPGARHAVLSFLSGFLFCNDISRIYQSLCLPVWAIHGTRGDFVDYRYEKNVAGKPNWWCQTFDTGAFPHFETLLQVTSSYDHFLGAQLNRKDI